MIVWKFIHSHGKLGGFSEWECPGCGHHKAIDFHSKEEKYEYWLCRACGGRAKNPEFKSQ